MEQPAALTPNQLRRKIDPQTLTDLADLADDPSGTIVGQDRALAALHFGLSLRDHGFNVFVAGAPGVGKMTTVEAFIAELAGHMATPPDYCYVHNFQDTYEPAMCRLPAGRGREFQRDMKQLIDQLRRDLPRTFESDEYSSHHGAIVKEFEDQRAQMLEQVNAHAAERGFVIRPTAFGLAIIPLIEGRPMSEEEFQGISAEAREQIKHHREILEAELEDVMKQSRAREREMRKQIDELDRQAALYVVRQSIEDLEERYADLPPVHAYLAAVQEDVLAHVAAFKDSQPADGESGGPAEAAARERFFHRYEVNLLIDNSKREGAPVVVETAPTVANLGGRIEKEALFGALFTDVTMIRPGSLHKANGGFLVLPIEDVLREPFAWDTLKRALKNHEVQIEDPGERIGAISARGLRPQAVPLDLKVVLVGSPYLYSMLHAYDDDFAELFKVKADFDNRMALNSEHTRRVLQVLRDFCAREGVPSIDNEGAARILEHALRLAEDQQYLSTQFGALTDLLREASYWVDRTGATQISAEHVRRALAAQRYRAGRMPERLRELIARRLLIIETTGSVIGQINGLAVISTGDNAFGQPTRITVSVGPGREGVVDIEREARLGGPIHSKGVMILGGYLSQTYAPNRPTSLKARLVFEQSYDGVDGDSASSAELYALVSALAEVPLRQGIAVTGAISQRGEIQAIGGVNEKIEGFFDICSALGLTGDQGVLIPQANVEHLMLREDLVEAVAAGRFHIWAARTANEGIALLTGQTAGERDADGNFPPDTINARVAVRLQQFLDSLHPIDQWRKRQPDD